MTDAAQTLFEYARETIAESEKALIYVGRHTFAATRASTTPELPGVGIFDLVTGATIMIRLDRIDAVLESPD